MLNPTWYPSSKQLRQFAVAALFGFGLLGLMSWRSAHVRTAEVFWALGALTFVAELIRPGAILPIYTLLMGLTFPIGWLISNLFLRIIFYAILTPVGFVFRLIGRDPLTLRRPTANSYWRPFEMPRDAASYYRQG